MKNTRVVITGHGGPEVLKLIEEDLPEPGAGQVRLKVLVTGVAFADVLMRYGMYPGVPPIPFSPGYDVVGVVDKIGDGVTEFKPGDTVAALIMESRHLDVLEMDAASHTGVGDVRQITDGVNYAPASARYKVYIIDEVHMEGC